MWRKWFDSIRTPGTQPIPDTPPTSARCEALVRLVYHAAWDEVPIPALLTAWARRLEREGFHCLIRIAGEIGEDPKLHSKLSSDTAKLEFLTRLHLKLLDRPLETKDVTLWLPYTRAGLFGVILRGIVGSIECRSESDFALLQDRALLILSVTQ